MARQDDRHVETVVSCICSAFVSGLDALRKIDPQTDAVTKQKKKKDGKRQKLVNYLKRGPEMIGDSYGKGYDLYGHRFEVGDAIAQTTLAEVLLRLSTGITTLTNGFLTRKNRGLPLDYATASDLADTARKDTCRALYKLNKRLQSQPPNQALAHRPLPTVAAASVPPLGQVKSNKADHKSKQHKTKINGPTLARITIQGPKSSSQIALVKPGSQPKQKKKSSLTVSSAKVKPTVTSRTASASTPNLAITNPISRPAPIRTNTNPDSNHPLPSTHHRAPVPPLPSSPPASNTPPPPYPTFSIPPPARRARQHTPTIYSTATAGTRLGEIPLHRWADSPDFDAMSMLNRQAVRDGWPLNEVEGRVEERRKGWRGWFSRR